MPPCGHFLFPSCGCGTPVAFTPLEPAPIASLLGPREPEPAAEPAAPEPRKKRGPGQPPSPWLLREREPIIGDGSTKTVRELEREAEDPAADLEARILAMLAHPEMARELLRQLDAEACRRRFSEFCRQAWHVIEPATQLTWNWHHELICCVLQGLFETWFEAMNSGGKLDTPIKNCVVNCPPGSLKSKLIAVFFPVWIWLRAPGTKLICLSVNEAAAHRDSRASRDLIRSPWFQTQFKPTWSLKDDQDAISNFGNDAGGERLSKPSGSEIVGLRGDFLIGDDLNNPLESEVENERNHVNLLWDTNQYNRVNDMRRSIRLCVQQRTHAEDHTGHVLLKQGHWSPAKPDGWLNVVLPAEAELARRFVMPEVLASALRRQLRDKDIVLEDPRTHEGDSIDPVRMPRETLAAERERWEGTGNYAGQMQQRPALVEGARVKRGYWGWFRLAGGVRDDIDEHETGRPRPVHCDRNETITIGPKHYSPGNWDFDWIYLSLDCAAKKTERGSNWGILVVAGKGGRRFVLDDRTQRGDILTIVKILRELIYTWRPDKVLIEDKAAGPDLKLRLLEEMTKGDIPMVTLEDVKVGMAGKEERLDSCLPTMANGLVYLRDGAPWLEAFVEELSLFPFGKNSDRVDSLTQALNHSPEFEENAWPAF